MKFNIEKPDDDKADNKEEIVEDSETVEVPATTEALKTSKTRATEDFTLDNIDLLESIVSTSDVRFSSCEPLVNL